jgi:prepilin-type N-terminal cleavage/methylation domain-containing protein
MQKAESRKQKEKKKPEPAPLQTANCTLRASSPRGLTLVEMLVTVAVFTVIIVVLSQSIIYFYKANRVAFEESYQIRSAERGMQILLRDLREATYGDDGAYPLAEMASSSVTFFSDVDRSVPIEKIRYSLSGKTLSRTVTLSAGEPPTYTGAIATTSVSEYVRNFEDNISMFRYYDENGGEVTNPADITDVVSVSISIVVDITPIHAPGEFTLRSGATMRNLRPQ